MDPTTYNVTFEDFLHSKKKIKGGVNEIIVEDLNLKIIALGNSTSERKVF
jgi:hypothetical protein